MTGKISLLIVLRNIVITTILVGLLFGLAGLLLGGATGFLNMVSWGLVIGFFLSFVLGATLYLGDRFWGSEFERISILGLGDWYWFAKQKKTDIKKP